MSPRATTSPAICAAIGKAVAEAGWSQHALARELGVAQSTVGRWGTEVEPRLDDLAALERLLGLARGELVWRAGYVADVASVAEAVRSDPNLDDRGRRLLMAVYRELLRAD